MTLFLWTHLIDLNLHKQGNLKITGRDGTNREIQTPSRSRSRSRFTAFRDGTGRDDVYPKTNRDIRFRYRDKRFRFRDFGTKVPPLPQPDVADVIWLIWLLLVL